ncbi:DMT family transporter [Microbacterium sp. G2-8]|uniref:DMT family transporter n=1 Tax=Microbacterium sp. G2-8 TaxID=2842454 RepID=UPI0021AA7661|nr:DMT family transporter [Microbacterium sp. G2-8]
MRGMGSAEMVPAASDELVGLFDNPGLLLGIPLAIAGAVFMSLGAQYQSRGVRKVEKLEGASGHAGLNTAHLLQLLRRPSWISGTLLLGAAIVCQLAALSVAPLIVVQPLGAISLVITTLLNARVSGHTPTRASLTAIGLCIGGIFVFVFFAALYAVESPISDMQLLTLLAILLIVLIVVGTAWLLFKTRAGALFYISAAGILYGFVATLAKVVIVRIQAGDVNMVTIACAVSLAAAALAGAYFVQTAYSSGPPDLVIAGLTVIDPIVAVAIGASLLGEAARTPVWTLVIWVLAGTAATVGVIMLAKSHPQVLSESQELPFRRGSGSTSDSGSDTEGR